MSCCKNALTKTAQLPKNTALPLAALLIQAVVPSPAVIGTSEVKFALLLVMIWQKFRILRCSLFRICSLLTKATYAFFNSSFSHVMVAANGLRSLIFKLTVADLIFASGKTDKPFFSVYASNLSFICDISLGSYADEIISLTPSQSGDYAFLVATGKTLPLDLENAPAGVCVEMVMQSVDAGIMAVDKSCNRIWASIPYLRRFNKPYSSMGVLDKF